MIAVDNDLVADKLERLVNSFQTVLYEDDDTFMEGMKSRNLTGCDINRFRHWEWTQGVGLFGFWKLYKQTGRKEYLDLLLKFYDEQIEGGLPSRNINTTAPLLALSFIYEETGNELYGQVCDEWADWLMRGLPRTKGGGFQHLTSDTLNDQELWDDTLFMAVLFLANIGRIRKNSIWIEEAKYQFLIHTKYLTDNASGLWRHGWTFNGRHNFAGALWGRGNSWVTAAIPEFLEIVECEESIKRFLIETLESQVEALEKYQDPCGMWHTLIDDASSYTEASCTCGFAYGMLNAVRKKLIDPRYREVALKALSPILGLIDENGILNKVSYGTAMGRESLEFYKGIEIKSMPYGTAMAILFLLEVKSLII